MPGRKIRGGFLASFGYILSPLSCWNDAFVNLPLAYGFGLAFGLISTSLFMPAIIVGYWITNILGFVLMHMGVVDVMAKKGTRYTRKDVLKDFILSVAYTAVVAGLVVSGIIRFPTEYFT
ncbi:MAG TPA: hypothetical protein HA349_06865 [Methanotrichaceae archaeon]|nr:hypothetical protein [Methanotrichaceae archaeon]